jgi:hypothetical protein
MLQAEKKAGERIKEKRPNWVLWGLAVAACLLVAWFVHIMRDQGPVIPSVPANTAVNIIPVHDQIVLALNRVSKAMEEHLDVNGDGLTNCIDAAVTFYKYFPDKSKVCIEVNYNPDVDMHHLFNCVFIDDNWRAIEPQAYWKNHKSYYMRDVWGSQYDSSKNKDVTEEYLKYVK